MTDLKSHLRITHTAEDPLLALYLQAAREHVEWRARRTLFETVWELVFDRFPSCGYLTLRQGAPLLSVTWIKYTDSDAVTTTWGSSNYIVNTDAMPGIVTPVSGGSWPDFSPAPSAAVRVRYVSGLSLSASPLVYPPEYLLMQVRLLAGVMYEHREGEFITDVNNRDSLLLKYGLEALMSQSQVEYEF